MPNHDHEHLLFKWIVLRVLGCDLAPLFRDLSQSEKLSEIEPPLDETIRNTKLVENGVFGNHVILKVVKLSEKSQIKYLGICLKADLQQKFGMENWKMKSCDQTVTMQFVLDLIILHSSLIFYHSSTSKPTL